MALVSIVLALGLVQIDQVVSPSLERKIGWIYSGGPTGARAVLSTIAGSVITVAGTTFSVTIAALSLASSQFGPRLLRTFRRDLGNQIVLGTFISTFLYCLLVLRTVRGAEQQRYVPGLSVTLGVVLAVFSLAVLIYFIHHTAASIQVSTLIDSVSRDLECTIEDNFPARGKLREEERSARQNPTALAQTQYGETIPVPQRGYLLHTDDRGLLALAERNKCTIQVCCRPGDFVVAGMPLASLSPGTCADGDFRKALQACFYFGIERTPEQDPEYALLQVAQIAVRALSPGVNDPFTAISCIDRLTAAMVMMTERRMWSSFRYDSAGNLRVVTKPATYKDLTNAAFSFIRRAAESNREVLGHLLNCIRLVLDRVEDQELRRALQDQYELTAADLKRSAL